MKKQEFFYRPLEEILQDKNFVEEIENFGEKVAEKIPFELLDETLSALAAYTLYVAAIKNGDPDKVSLGIAETDARLHERLQDFHIVSFVNPTDSTVPITHNYYGNLIGAIA